MYSIVDFDNDGGVAVVPTVWIQEDKTMCLWPPSKSTASIIAAVKKQTLPKPGKIWPPQKLRKILKSYGSYAEARKHLDKSTKRSDLTSDTERETKKKRRQKSFQHKYLTSHSSSKVRKLPKHSKLPANRALPKPPAPPELEFGAVTNSGSESTTPGTSFATGRPSSSIDGGTSPFQYSFVSAEGVENQQIQFQQDGTLSSEHNEFTNHGSPPNSHLETNMPPETITRRPSRPVLEIVMDQLSEIQESLKTLHSKIDSYGTSGAAELDSEFEDEEFKRAETVSDLKCISQRVCNQPDYKRKLIIHLYRSGGGTRTCSKFLYKMLSEMMSDKVAAEYSYRGQREKRSFEDLQLKSVYTACLKKNPLTRKTSIVFDVEDAIGNWLKRAKQRIDRKNAKNCPGGLVIDEESSISDSEFSHTSDENSD